MAARLRKRLGSDRGASLSFALLAFLVCAGVAAVVIAAATASAGQFAELAKMDQRYYAVTSAANLFRDTTLGTDGEEEITFVQVVEGTGFERVDIDGDDDIEGLTEDVEDITWNTQYVLQDPIPTSSDGFNFLPAVTCFALYGLTSVPAADVAVEDPAYSETHFPSSAWNMSTKGHPDYVSFGYEIVPTLPDAEASSADLTVEVEARLRTDWTLELLFYNKTDNETDRFYLYLLLEGMLEEETETSEALGDTVVDDSGVVRNAVTLTKTRTSSVTWQLRQIVPGKGFANG